MDSLNRFLAILDKCARNSLILFFLLAGGCSSKKSNIHSEIICHDGRKFLIKHKRAAETSDGIRKFYDTKMRAGTKENYTVIKYKDGFSVQIKRVPPEELVQCQVREIYWERIEHWYDGTSGSSKNE